jgi:hypothetical protein
MKARLILKHQKAWVVPVIMQALLTVAVGCSSVPASAPSPTATSIPDVPMSRPVASTPVPSTPTPVPATPTLAVPTDAPSPEVKVGGFAGDHMPDFEMTLLDGTEVTLASLSGEGRPVFLFFFTKW